MLHLAIRCLFVLGLTTAVTSDSSSAPPAFPDPAAGLKLPRDPVPDRVSIRRGLKPKEKHTYATLDGPGCIRHIWITPSRSEVGHRQTIIRIYFDGARTPHVEAPVGDFFGIMHGKKFCPVNTQYLAASAEIGYNCYFAMPFAKEARISF